MIRSLISPWVWAPATGLALGACAWQLVRGMRRRRASELERQVLELLCLATERGKPLAPVLRRAAGDARRREARWLDRIAGKLEDGAPLSEAVARAGACFAPHVVVAIAAAEGGAQLAVVLRDLARRRDAGTVLRYRLALAAAYPALLGVVTVVLLVFGSEFAQWAGMEKEFAQILGFGGPVPGRMSVLALAVAVPAVCIALWVALAFGDGRGRAARALAACAQRMPWLGAKLHLLSCARALQASAALTAGGASLGEALRSAAPVAADARCARDFAAAAACADAGSSAAEAWSRAGLPAFVTARLGVAGHASREMLAARLGELAQVCNRRVAESAARAQHWMQVGALLAFGAIVALQMARMFEFLERARESAMEVPVVTARSGEAGFTMMELTCAFVVIASVGIGLVHGGTGHTHAVTRAFRETVALRVAQGELEAVRVARAGVVPGESAVEVTAEARRLLEGVEALRVVREREKGLLEVEVVLRWGDGESVVLTTLLATEATR